MDHEHTCEYHLDARDRISFVGQCWACCALRNSCPQLTEASVMSHPIWQFIGNRETHIIYEMLFDQVRQAGRTIRFTYRCDAADALRVFEMTLSPMEDAGVRVNNLLIREEPRPSLRLMEANTPRSDDMVCICSWCARVHLEAGRWVEIEEALSESRLFEGDRLPQLTHGICADCFEKWFSHEALEGV